ncbi:hypothetical protein OB955_05595 [Halobacteria archaeon AArc-m2/3/4]|uniref:Halobacterial output domain-containing protein n=1 Tax=Natronoglomus mannanivorans TaxID=2979990 RepID=A0AAP3E322_9EURY|nr:hypothetical protein [Halobacteria archaeon AArc-xg1-1]MCU4972207.1 hypothetical protein [Halobacteria archaeon AArc-m2/3/4]
MESTLAIDADDVSDRIVAEVASRDGVDPIELPPLFDAVDPDALDVLFAPKANGETRQGRVWFPYAGYDVTIEYDGELAVTIE